MDTIEVIHNIQKISMDMDQLAYKISYLEEEIAKLCAYVEEIKGSENDIRRVVS